MSGLKLAVFDMDGTLMDSQDVIVEAMTRAFSALDLPVPSRPATLSIVGLSLHEAITRLAPDLDRAALEALVQGYKDSFVALRAEHGGEASAPLYPGARAALALLHARADVLMGVATGKARRGLDHAFAAHDLAAFFVTSQTADHHPSKPHPSMLWSCLRDTGVDSGQAVMIGDTSFDIEMGRAAGFRTIGVTWGYHEPRDLRQAGADLLLDGFDDLPDALESLWSVAA